MMGYTITDEMIAEDPILRYLVPNPNLPERLLAISHQFETLAASLWHDVPRNPERTVAFRKLLEAKDCAVRAALP